jgi:hypothetical protein
VESTSNSEIVPDVVFATNAKSGLATMCGMLGVIIEPPPQAASSTARSEIAATSANGFMDIISFFILALQNLPVVRTQTSPAWHRLPGQTHRSPCAREFGFAILRNVKALPGREDPRSVSLTQS